MFSQVMLLQEHLLHSSLCGIHSQRIPSDKRDLFGHDRVMHRFCGVLAPGKGAVTVN